MNYIIEDTVNFYDQLNNNIDDDCSDDCNTCLITYEPLLSDFVTMECGHKFNYTPLFNDVLNHKTKYNSLETSLGKLKHNEIRCPYCRNKQTTMLPYYENKGFEKVNGVNFLGAPKCYAGNVCAHKWVNFEFDATLPDSDQNPQWLSCTSTFTYKMFANNYGDNNYYCYYHTKVVSKLHKSNAKAEAKQILKANKELAIQQVKIEKATAKAAEKAEKETAKAAAKTDKAIKNTDKAIKNADKALAKAIKNADKVIKHADKVIQQADKVIIQSDKATTVKELMNVVLCSHIFMRGNNIGSCCGVKVLTGSPDALCKRHSKKIIQPPIIENTIIENTII